METNNSQSVTNRKFGKDITEFWNNRKHHRNRAYSYKHNQPNIKNALPQIQIYQYLFNVQKQPRIQKIDQPQISTNMRAILIDWIIDVHNGFKLNNSTLYKCLYYIDSYLSMQFVSRKQFQLLGIVCLFIAAKIQQIYPNHISAYIQITDNTYSKKEFLQMEGHILKTLNFQLNQPTVYDFLNNFDKEYQKKTVHLAQYIIELGFLEQKMRQNKQSHMAIGALYLASKMRKQNNNWHQIAQKQYKINMSQILKIARQLCFIMQKQRKELKATKKKFSTEKYMFVSKIRIQKKA